MPFPVAADTAAHRPFRWYLPPPALFFQYFLVSLPLYKRICDHLNGQTLRFCAHWFSEPPAGAPPVFPVPLFWQVHHWSVLRNPLWHLPLPRTGPPVPICFLPGGSARTDSSAPAPSFFGLPPGNYLIGHIAAWSVPADPFSSYSRAHCTISKSHRPIHSCPQIHFPNNNCTGCSLCIPALLRH